MSEREKEAANLDIAVGKSLTIICGNMFSNLDRLAWKTFA